MIEMDKKEIYIKINSCTKCNYHKIVPDPDPDDWFYHDDKAIICTKVASESKKVVSSSTSPTEIKDFEYIPDWCPLIQEFGFFTKKS
jgi:hypothetical protein